MAEPECRENGLFNERDYHHAGCAEREYCGSGACALRSTPAGGGCQSSDQCYDSYCFNQQECRARLPLDSPCSQPEDDDVRNAQCQWPYACFQGTCQFGTPHVDIGPPTCMTTDQDRVWQAFLTDWGQVSKDVAVQRHMKTLVQFPIYFVGKGQEQCNSGEPSTGGGGEDEDFLSEYGLYLAIIAVVFVLVIGLLVFCVCCRKGRRRGGGGGGGTYRDDNGHHVSSDDHGYSKKQLAALERQHAMPKGPAWMSGGGDIFMGGGHVGFFPGEGGGGITYKQPDQNKSFSDAGRVSYKPETSNSMFGANTGPNDSAQSRYQASKDRDAAAAARAAGGQVRTRQQDFDGW